MTQHSRISAAVPRVAVLLCLIAASSLSLFAQQTTTSNAVVPTLVNFSGMLTGGNGKPLSGITGVTFSLYAEQQGGAPLWMETQNVQPDRAGNYSVMLGATTSQGLPSSLFVSGQARWLEVQAQGQGPQPRVMLMSVPYALKAGDAQTIGGLPPSAFVLAAPTSGAAAAGPASSQNPAPPGSSDVTTSGGTVGTIPFFSTATDIENSVITQSGTGSKAKIGINTTTPASTLDVKGAATVRGLLALPSTKTATATQGYDSQPIEQSASAYNSGTGTAVAQNFEWQAEPTGNDTSSPNGTLNLLFAQGSNKLAETGLNIASNGQINFASGQTFPGAGTITGVTAGSGLSGGGSSGNVTLSVPSAGITNAMLQNSSLTVSPGGGMTGGGKISLGGSATLGLENCSANQVLEFVSGAWTCANAGTGTITGVTAGTGLSGGGTSGNVTLNNTGLLGITAGSGISVGSGQTPTVANTGVLAVTAGTGISSTGGQSPTLGINTSVVPELNAANTFTSNQTINGNATVSGVVGIGTTTPRTTLEIDATAQSALAPTVTLTNNGGLGQVSLDFNTYTPSTSGTYNPASRIWVTDDNDYSDNIYFQSNIDGAPNSGLQTNLTILSGGAVGIGTTTPAAQLDVRSLTGAGFLSAINAVGFNAPANSGFNGSVAVYGTGGNGDPYTPGALDGPGGRFVGGSSAGFGDGVDVYAGSGYAGVFYGNVEVGGNLSKSSGSFKIDHPLDPANKYLYHSFVESPDMMNVYNGIAMLDSSGEATITMPDWFSVLNRDFRYQLTAIGAPGPNLYIAEEFVDGHFKIAGGQPGSKVSWQITGIRQDAWANAHRIPVEEEKEDRLKGFYIHPELYGQPDEKQIEWARHPQTMKKMKEMKEKQKQQTGQVRQRASAQPLTIEVSKQR